MGLEQNPKSIRRNSLLFSKMTILMCWMFDSGLLIGDGLSELWIWLVEGVGLRLNVVAEVKVASWQRQGGGLMLSTLRLLLLLLLLLLLFWWVCCFPLKLGVLQKFKPCFKRCIFLGLKIAHFDLFFREGGGGGMRET